MLSRRQLGGLLAGGAWCWGRPAAAAPRASLLFSIARSKNANVVRYVALLDGQRLDPRRPIHAYWQMLAEDGRREELSFAEHKLAYGFEVSRLGPTSCELRLVAFAERVVLVERSSHGVRALVRIAGEQAVLQRIFVKASEGGLLPSVEYVDVRGTSLSGAPVSERLRAR